MSTNEVPEKLRELWRLAGEAQKISEELHDHLELLIENCDDVCLEDFLKEDEDKVRRQNERVLRK